MVDEDEDTTDDRPSQSTATIHVISSLNPQTVNRVDEHDSGHERLPGPRLPAIVQTVWWLVARVHFARYCARRYGTCYRLRLIYFGEVNVIADPSTMRAVLRAPDDALLGGEANRVGGLLELLLGEGNVFVADTTRHRQLRLELQRALHGTQQLFSDAARAATSRAIAHWPIEQPFPLLPEMEEISLEVFADAALGLKEADERGEVLSQLRLLTSLWISPQVVLPFLRGRFGRRAVWRRFQDVQAATMNTLLTLIERERRALQATTTGQDVPSKRQPSVISRLASGRFGDEEIGGALLTILFAGHQNTANALAWMLELSIRSPEALLSLEGSPKDDMEFWDACVRETLRIRPVGQWMARRATRDVSLGRYGVTTGSLVVPNAFIAQHDPTVFADPECFCPKRFLADADHEGWLPFGDGQRSCLGAEHAMAQMQAISALIFSSCELIPAREKPERIVTRGLTFVPKHGVSVVMRQTTQHEASHMVPQPGGA